MVEKKTIAVITCYYQPDYVRARTLRAALQTMPAVEVIIIKNRHRSLLRYPEVIWKLWRLKHTQEVDAYLLTFRGQEILPLVLWAARKKPVIFDEFIVPLAYATQEKHAFSFGSWLRHITARLAQPFYRRWLKRCRWILADTAAHAVLSAEISGISPDTYLVSPVGTDEQLFKPWPPTAYTDIFQVFYYSSGMQPLHGIPIVLQAAELLKDNPRIRFLLAGGKQPMQRAIKAAQRRGANIEYQRWIPFETLISTIHNSGVCLGGPFGDTPQAHHVITGKTYQFLAAGAPTIIGASDTTNQYFHDKQNGLVVRQADPQALADAIIWASQHPQNLQRIAEKGHLLYSQEFSTTAIARRLRPLIDQLI